MKVNLVALTQPMIEGINTAEELIVFCARVSNPNNQLNFGTSEKLIQYCIKHQHWSIFAQADMTVRIETSRAIGAQIIRHKSADFQEFSQRYAAAQAYEPIELRKQGATNRQVGDEPYDPIFDLEGHNASWVIEQFIKDSEDLYNKLISHGIAKECARMVLPMTTQTTLFMKNNIRNWLAYLNVRLHNTCQKEHREVAEKIRDIFLEQFPIVSSCFDNFTDSFNTHFM